MLITEILFILYVYFTNLGRSLLIFLKSVSHFYIAFKKTLYYHSVQLDPHNVLLSIARLILSLVYYLHWLLLFEFHWCWVLHLILPSLTQKYRPPISTTPLPPFYPQIVIFNNYTVTMLCIVKISRYTYIIRFHLNS